MNPLAALDQRYVWHPFTQMKNWLKNEPIVITKGQGAELQDARGRKYLDANSSIWTNLHGHNHPRINVAIGRQLKKIAHSSALGFANEPASLLAEKLVAAANPKQLPRRKSETVAHPKLPKPFFPMMGPPLWRRRSKWLMNSVVEPGALSVLGSSPCRVPTTATRSGRFRLAILISSIKVFPVCCSKRIW